MAALRLTTRTRTWWPDRLAGRRACRFHPLARYAPIGNIAGIGDSPAEFGPLMTRANSIFMAACIGLIGGLAGVVAYLAFGLSNAASAVVAFATLTGLAIFNALTTRGHSDSAAALADLSNATADLAKRVAEVTEQIDAAEANAKWARDPSEATAGETGALDARITELADAVTAHDAALLALDARIAELADAITAHDAALGASIAAPAHRAAAEVPAPDERLQAPAVDALDAPHRDTGDASAARARARAELALAAAALKPK